MKSFRLLAFVACVGLLSSAALPQGGLGKGRGDKGQQSGGNSGGQSSGGQSSGGLGRGQGGGQSGGSQTGRGQGGSNSGGSSSGGQGGLGRGRDQGGSSSGGLGSGGGNQTGRGQGGGSSSGGLGSGGGSSSGGQGGLGKGRGNQGGNSGGGSSSGGSSSGGGLGNQGGSGRSSGGASSGGLGGGGSTTGGQGGLGSQGGYGRGGNDQGRNDQNRGNGGSLGRIDTGNDRVNSIGKSQSGRTGGTNYGSNSTINRNDRNQFNIDTPRLNLNKGSLQLQVQRSETIQLNRGRGYDNGYYNGWRQGYCSYNNGWRDDNFYYPYYQFDPWGRNCSVSPWYFYYNLPGYISVSRITYYQNTSCNWGYGQIYNWNRGGYGNGGGYWNNGYDRRNNDLDDTLDDLVRAFERGDSRALGRLVPRRGRVNIYMDDQYCYSLNSDDFYDLMMDNIQNTRTSRYEITRVRTYGDEAQISAEHQYTDPWGRRACVYHNYRLERDRFGYVITDFRTSNRM